ncbi:MAG: metal-dependent transcriptional regulator [Oscillospiraceae bacterium]|nr:metal-dependent transcriptional regulator [Oscillospiraceae bacterium]
MAIRQSGEDYLETILKLQMQNGQVRSVDVAADLGYSKPSVSIAMKKLREQGYVSVNENGLLSLTEEGKQVATGVYERHKTLKQALMLLGVEEADAAEEACKIEHAISDTTLDKIKAFLEKAEA